MSDNFDREALERLIVETGARIQIKTGAGKILELMPKHLGDNQQLPGLLSPKQDMTAADMKDNHDKIHNDNHDKTTSNHDKGAASMLDYWNESANGLFVDGIREDQIEAFKNAAGEILKGRDLFIKTKE